MIATPAAELRGILGAPDTDRDDYRAMARISELRHRPVLENGPPVIAKRIASADETIFLPYEF